MIHELIKLKLKNNDFSFTLSELNVNPAELKKIPHWLRKAIAIYSNNKLLPKLNFLHVAQKGPK